MSSWVVHGLRTRRPTTAYPRQVEATAGVTPGRPQGAEFDPMATRELVETCPTRALAPRPNGIGVDERRCVHCFRCARTATPLPWVQDYEWATRVAEPAAASALGAVFRHSLHLIVVDAGDCGACWNEVRQLNNPHYNMHRLGFFLTPTPRHADVLLVVGPGTDPMRIPLLKAYDAMPTPKAVVAVGTCALSGSVFGPSFASAGGVGSILPVDVEVPGQPPPPLAILHGLLLAVGRADGSAPDRRESSPGDAELRP